MGPSIYILLFQTLFTFYYYSKKIFVEGSERTIQRPPQIQGGFTSKSKNISWKFHRKLSDTANK